MIDTLAGMWTVLTLSWPIWAFIALMTAYAMWACRASAGDRDYPPRSPR